MTRAPNLSARVPLLGTTTNNTDGAVRLYGGVLYLKQQCNSYKQCVQTACIGMVGSQKKCFDSMDFPLLDRSANQLHAPGKGSGKARRQAAPRPLPDLSGEKRSPYNGTVSAPSTCPLSPYTSYSRSPPNKHHTLKPARLYALTGSETYVWNPVSKRPPCCP